MSCKQQLSSTTFPYPALRQTLPVVLHSCHLDILTWQKFVSVYSAALHLVNLTNAFFDPLKWGWSGSDSAFLLHCNEKLNLGPPFSDCQ